MLFAQPGRRPGARPVPDWAKVHLELRRKGVTLMLLWHEYKRDLPRRLRLQPVQRALPAWKLHLDVVMRQEHKAGEKMFVDFPGQTVPIYDGRTGQVAMQAELFVAALGASGLIVLRVVPVPGTAALGHRPRARFFGLRGLPGDRGVRQPALGGDPPAPLRARRERHLFRDGGPLPGGDNAGPLVQTSGQGQGRNGRAIGRALGHGPAYGTAISPAWPRPTPPSPSWWPG